MKKYYLTKPEGISIETDFNKSIVSGEITVSLEDYNKLQKALDIANQVFKQIISYPIQTFKGYNGWYIGAGVIDNVKDAKVRMEIVTK